MADPYLDARADVISKSLDVLVGAFLAGYNPNLPTVMVLPGGMGSQLDRSPAPFNPPQELPLGQFEPAWIDFGLLFGGEARHLAISPAGHDAGDHVVVANGPLRFLGMNKPYDITEKFFADEGFNYTVFGYDWRRPVSECAQWLETFLEKIRTRVEARHNGHVFQDVSIVAHSQGGLVATMLLQNLFGGGAGTATDVKVSRIGRVITVGTPFYAASHNMFRYFRGQSPLNAIYGVKDVAQIAGSLPGPYILNYPDRALFTAEGGLGLTRYPVRDGADPDSLEADPFDAAIQATRYPPWMSKASMDAGRRQKKKICRPLPGAARSLLWHIRSGLTRTPVEIHWDGPAGATFDFDTDPYPFREVLGEGDGVVPIWSSALTQTPDEQVYDCTTADEHETLLEHAEPLKAALRVITAGKFPKTVTVPAAAPEPSRASSAKVRKLTEEIAAGTAGPDDPRLNDRAVWRRLIEEAHLC